MSDEGFSRMKNRSKFSPETSTNRYQRKKTAQWSAKIEKARRVASVLIQVLTLVAVAIGVPVLIFVSYNGVASSDYFHLKEIHVLGNHYLTPDYIIARAQIEKGVNIFDIDEKKMEDALVSDPWISGVQLETELPNTLNVTVTEFIPVAMLVQGNQWQLVDATGIPFKTFEPTDPAEELLRLPLITGPSAEEMNNEDVRHLVVKGIGLYNLYRAYPMSKDRKISEVHIDPVTGLTMVLSDGLRVQLGEGTHMRDRLDRLQVVLQHLEKGERPDYVLIDQDNHFDRVTVGRYSAS